RNPACSPAPPARCASLGGGPHAKPGQTAPTIQLARYASQPAPRAPVPSPWPARIATPATGQGPAVQRLVNWAGLTKTTAAENYGINSADPTVLFGRDGGP